MNRRIKCGISHEGILLSPQKEGRLGVVVHTYNSSIWDYRQEDHKFEASLGYIVRPCLILPSPRKKGTSAITWMNLETLYQKKEGRHKRSILSHSICVKCPEQANPWRQKPEVVVARAGVGE
jgi:hypothetical protein